MVYAISYRPKLSSYPNFDALDGDRSKIALEDPTPDGGAGIATSPIFSGRRLKVDHLPTRIRWRSRRPLLDLESTWVHSVSARLRDLIEQLEPHVHQFMPVEFVGPDGSHLSHRWFWQVCNRIDSVHRDLSTWVLLKGVVWTTPSAAKALAPGRPDLVGAGEPQLAEKVEPRLVFDLRKIGNACFWHDKHRSDGPYVTDAVKLTLETAGMTGLHYHHYPDA